MADTKHQNLQVNDIMVIANNTNPRGEWPVGRILNVYPGKDGKIRSAMVNTFTGEYLRPVEKLCLLEEESSS